MAESVNRPSGADFAMSETARKAMEGDIRRDTNRKLFERLERLIQQHQFWCRVDFDYGDESTGGGFMSDYVAIIYGDTNCPHAHRFDIRTGHGCTMIDEEWDEGDKNLDSLKRALDRFEAEIAADYDCKECEKILKEKKV